jgi:SAM-dependent methyltransferase
VTGAWQITRAELAQRIETGPLSGVQGAFIAQMWRYALDRAAQSDAEVAVSEECDAIPYLPVQPESLGVTLTTDSRLLDIGCLGGYGLYDIALRRNRAGVPVPAMTGLDVNPLSVQVGADMAKVWAQGLSVKFREADCTAMPVPSASFDVTVARLLLPYVPVKMALRAIAGVVKPGGLVYFQVHTLRYYWKRCLGRLSKPAAALYYVRPLISGLFFAAVGRQPVHRLFAETALPPAGLRRLCGRVGLAPVWAGGFQSKPILVFRKVDA